MNGRVDHAGRALVTVAIRGPSVTNDRSIDAWIDTGFTGELVLPQKLINDLALPQSGTVKAIRADGSEVTLLSHTCLVGWLDQVRQLDVVANNGEYPLLGNWAVARA